MKVLFIIGPYRADTHSQVARNIITARAYAEKYWSKKYSVICPQLNSAFMSGVVDEQVFLDGYLEQLRRSDVVLVLPGWKESEGSNREVMLATELDKEFIWIIQ